MFTDGQATGWTLLEDFLSQLEQPSARSQLTNHGAVLSLHAQAGDFSVEKQTPEFSHNGLSPITATAAALQLVSTTPLSAVNLESVPIPNDPIPTTVPTPKSGGQLYTQRITALRKGQLYTRLPANSFQSEWSKSVRQPTYEQWKHLLSLEAKAVAKGQGNNRLSVLVGDSLSLWFPSNRLPTGQLWLNQGISGDTTEGILQRLSAFASTRPSHIYVMAGINDLRHGATDTQVVQNLQKIVQRLKQAHPEAKIVIQSILPTDRVQISNSQILQINRKIEAIAQRENIQYLDLFPHFATHQTNIRQELTTDGIHLTLRGYATWQWALGQMDSWLTASRI
jgi:lysophospholipase L1-like esterase